MSIFCCPICGGPLERGPSAYSCPAGHSFDLAREGYVHLLPANRMHSKMPGDDKGMAAARWAFLSKDYYAPLRDALCSIALANTGPAPSVLDTGCGEGYYTAQVLHTLQQQGRTPSVCGVDISRDALICAHRRAPGGPDKPGHTRPAMPVGPVSTFAHHQTHQTPPRRNQSSGWLLRLGHSAAYR